MKTTLNPNQAIVTAIQNRLVITGNFCPCVSSDLWNEDYQCPCKKFREAQECCCHLYVKADVQTEE